MPLNKPPRNAGSIDDRIADWEKGLRIDKHQLDLECEQHGDIFYRISEALALAISRRDEMINNLKDLDADLDADIRADAAKAGEKITETGIKTEIRRTPDFRALTIEVQKAGVVIGRLMALKEGFQQRSYMLTNLTTLHQGNYFSTIQPRQRPMDRNVPPPRTAPVTRQDVKREPPRRPPPYSRR